MNNFPNNSSLFTRKNSGNLGNPPNLSYGNNYKDESILKYTNASTQGLNFGSNTNNNTNNSLKPPTGVREFGKDLTNVMQQRRFGNLPNKYMNLIKPTKKEKDELKKQLTKNDVSLYNLRPRNGVSVNSKNNSTNNSFSHNNENENIVNVHNVQNFHNVHNVHKPIPQMPKQKSNFNFNSSNHGMDVDSISIENNINQEINFKSNFFSYKGEKENKEIINNTISTSYSVNTNPQLVKEYLTDINIHMRETELINYPKYGYMRSQQDINEKMRAILIDWIVDVHLKFKLLPETLFLTTQIIDRFLEKIEINRNKLQLVGVTALFIACKYEEIYPPELKDFVYITDKAYTKTDILMMEKEILNVLNFDITHPSSLRFLELYLQLLDTRFDDTCVFFTKYLLELYLIEYKMIKYSPSWLAAATLYITIKVKKPALSKNFDLFFITGYTEDKLKECARDIIIILDCANKTSLQAVRNKYSMSKFMDVANWKKSN
jgi:cyclin B